MSPAAAAAPDEGKTNCKPSGAGNLGLTCTGTYSGNTAFDPWAWKNLPASQPPTVTISQAKDLTDQDVTVSWSNFTPSIGSNTFEPNPASDAAFYQVSLLQCNGVRPDASEGYDKDCYLPPVGSPVTAATQGPPNAQLATTLDTTVPPNALPAPNGGGPTPYSPLYPVVGGTAPAGWKNTPAGWTGEAQFHVEAVTPRTKGGFFHCSSAVACTLVIDPNFGGTPQTEDNFTDASTCGTHNIGGDIPQLDGSGGSADVGDFLNGGGQPYGSTRSAGLSSQGASAACWTADRIVIPLSFAPTSDNCPVKTPQFYAQGSPMLQTQIQQWQAGWCTGSSPLAVHTSFTTETNARNGFLAGSQSGSARVDMALVTQPAAATSSSRTFTYAPLANTGAGVAFYLDDGTTGSQVRRMVLSPRLLAKLTTQSYTLQYGCMLQPDSPWPKLPAASEYCDPAVKGNPYSLFDDPDFLSLNKQCEPYGQPLDYDCSNDHVDPASQTHFNDFPTDTSSDNAVAAGNNDIEDGGFLPTVLSQNSDMTYDLTNWMATDPSAASFLSGHADPWKMHVNTNYTNVDYPTQLFTMQDNGVSYPGGSLPACNQDCSNETALHDASMNVAWNFQVDLPTIAGDLLTYQPTASEPVPSCGLSADVACIAANQFNPTTGLVPLTLGNRNLLSELDLGDIMNYKFPAASLVNGDGKAVAPTPASIESAVKDMKTNPDGVTQTFNFASKDPDAYPLAMVSYAMVPTCGLSTTEASAIAGFLTRAATTGQVQGGLPGQLGPGYYPLNSTQKAQALATAQKVKNQKACPKPSSGGNPGSTSGTGTSPGTSSGTNPAATGQPGTSTSAPASTVAPANLAAPSVTPTPSTGTGQPVAFGEKSPDSGMSGLLLLLAIIAGVLLLLGAPAAWALSATGKWPVVFGWLDTARSSATRLIGRGPRGA